MLKRLFGKVENQPTFTSVEKLNKTLEKLEGREEILLKRVATEIDKAKRYIKAQNGRAALQCLKRKKLYDAQLEHLWNIQSLMIMLEGAKNTVEIVGAVRNVASALNEEMRKSIDIDDIEKSMEEINKQREKMRQIGVCVTSDLKFNEAEIEADLRELEHKEIQLERVELEGIGSEGTATEEVSVMRVNIITS
ncbi:hypothetical protein SUGI_0634510 [Cryptomeria japonica]|uniref:vacuolar protein sorting-associated protein 32 homolog 2-like n=1 Tax=Cryptomeria japonica TaxID=3369 RepID=UPI0024147C26|nr:vacuolar protein sorting-associated protein 32 homolog 2-like [Cryptomeria japonica]GLJ31606.1 hypothetical protein SUGI_0634510 [Cryptomeria japonica]